MLLSLPVILLAVAATAYVYLRDDSAGEFAFDASLCPSGGGVSARKAFLVDLTKPIDSERHSVPRALVSDAIDDLEQDAELRVYLLSGSADTPRTELGRLCKPFANADLNVATKDYGGATMRGCDELPAQLTPEVRELTTRFCAIREDLETNLSRAVESVAARTETDSSHLVEALEDLRIEMAEWPALQTLYVFSDMMQHADWFSHIDLPWQQWSYAEMAHLREELGWPSVPASEGTMRVELFYVPRIGSTDQPRIHRSHRQFWQEYFTDASVTFHDQEPMRQYRATAVMGLPTAEERAADARRELEDLRSEVREEQERLKAERERLVAQEEALQQEQQERAHQEDATAEGPADAVAQRQTAPAQASATQRTLAGEPPAQATATASRQASGGGPVAGTRTMPSRQEIADGPADSAPATQSRQVAVDRPTASGPAGRPESSRTGRTHVPTPQSRPPEVAEALTQAPADGGAAAGELSPVSASCALTLTPATAGLVPVYPRGGRTNFGAASVAIQYVVDAQGETIDGDVRMIEEESSAQRERYLSLFAESAMEVVQQWAFDITDADACAFPMERATTFEFTYQ